MTLAVNIAQGASNNVTFRNRIINGAASFSVRRGTTTAATLVSQARCGAYAAGTQVEGYGMTTFVALDSPASSSAVTYGIFVANIDGNPTYRVNDSSGISNFVLQEIAA